LVRRDPENRQFTRDRALSAAFLAGIRARAGKKEPARAMTQTALDGLRQLAERPGARWPDHKDYAWFLLSAPAAELRNPEEARRHAGLSVDKGGGSDPSAIFTLALAHDAAGDRKSAIDTARRALGLLPPGGSSHTREEIAESLKLWEAAAGAGSK